MSLFYPGPAVPLHHAPDRRDVGNSQLGLCLLREPLSQAAPRSLTGRGSTQTTDKQLQTGMNSAHVRVGLCLLH